GLKAAHVFAGDAPCTGEETYRTSARFGALQQTAMTFNRGQAVEFTLGVAIGHGAKMAPVDLALHARGGFEREQGEAGGSLQIRVEWAVLFTCHSNSEKPPDACQTATRYV